MMPTDSSRLNRTLGLWQVVLYGMGTILGAGIYVLVGELVAVSGTFSPLAFAGAGVIVAFSAYSFAVLARRFPVSAGPAAYVQEAFHCPWLAIAVGYAIVAAGIISSATIARGFIGYLDYFFTIPPSLAVSLFVITLTLVASRAVQISVGVAALTTILEILGLCLVILSAADKFPAVWQHPSRYFIPTEMHEWQTLGLGVFLAFYACIGFEDMVSIIEEIKRPAVTLPLAIVIVLALTTLLYILVTLAVLVSVPLNVLAGSDAPLALVMEHNQFLPVAVIGAISGVAIINGALIQIIMGSRVLYSMARQGMAPGLLSRIHPGTRIPHIATLVVGSGVLVFALVLPLVSLARLTSAIVLMIFLLVNLSLVKILHREHQATLPKTAPPVVGAILCALFLTLQWLAQ